MNIYEYVIYTDADELLVADPARWDTLLDYVSDAHPPVTTAFGMNLLHRMHHEISCDLAQPILPQRAWGFPISSMCKPLLIRTPVIWSPDFHGSNAPIEFDGLFLFHLAYFGYDVAIRRQQKRRNQLFVDNNTASHHRAGDPMILDWMEGWSSMPPDLSVTLTGQCAKTQERASRISYRLQFTWSPE